MKHDFSACGQGETSKRVGNRLTRATRDLWPASLCFQTILGNSSLAQMLRSGDSAVIAESKELTEDADSNEISGPGQALT